MSDQTASIADETPNDQKPGVASAASRCSAVVQALADAPLPGVPHVEQLVHSEYVRWFDHCRTPALEQSGDLAKLFNDLIAACTATLEAHGAWSDSEDADLVPYPFHRVDRMMKAALRRPGWR